ncbi:hypothetical protein HUA74_39380 [Myxococcus sp. CA051A]|uniref:hypothetical protein n=1 Tax=unclassified Myxococcus TaxID=2648731 RepID=UPI00157ADF21|nr:MULTISPECIES: hypothetical protein [unclassified Myxococcus]NTX17310.1 hypothetical protein [Myxococcus sp. CA056]NTX40250.1 hypothetical protein [Myxococcus sp. CA033]NTX51252.1 hypothetical protein [Myxococcus sp. CA039A]NTX66729.1 hypothetical protein [Myxococcus sp. CA051A]
MKRGGWSLLWLAAALTACEPAIIDHSATSNLLDAESASLETGPGAWIAWYGVTASRASTDAREGEAVLRVEVTEPYGWGVHLDNWPGFAASPGAHRASFWVRGTSERSPVAEMRVSWRDASGRELQSDLLSSPVLSSKWVRTARELTAPAGTERMSVAVTGAEGVLGEVIELDVLVVQALSAP